MPKPTEAEPSGSEARRTEAEAVRSLLMSRRRRLRRLEGEAGALLQVWDVFSHNQRMSCAVLRSPRAIPPGHMPKYTDEHYGSSKVEARPLDAQMSNLTVMAAKAKPSYARDCIQAIMQGLIGPWRAMLVVDSVRRDNCQNKSQEQTWSKTTPATDSHL